MQNIQESAASNCVERLDLSQFDLTRRAPITIEDFNISHPNEEAPFTKKDFGKALSKVSRKIKK